MPNINIGRGLTAGLLLAAMALPCAAYAADENQVKTAIAVAKAKIQTGDSLGATDQAADIQARARTALDLAQRELKKHHEDRAFHAAGNATALAEYAIASAELKSLTTQRDQLAAR